MAGGGDRQKMTHEPCLRWAGPIVKGLGRSAGLHSRAYVAQPGGRTRERRGGERAGCAGRDHDPAAHSIGAGARPGMAIRSPGRRAESQAVGSARRRTDCGGGPAAASDPGGASV